MLSDAVDDARMMMTSFLRLIEALKLALYTHQRQLPHAKKGALHTPQVLAAVALGERCQDKLGPTAETQQ